MHLPVEMQQQQQGASEVLRDGLRTPGHGAEASPCTPAQDLFAKSAGVHTSFEPGRFRNACAIALVQLSHTYM